MNQEEIEKIDRYLSGDMTEREREVFENQLLKDDDLKHSLEIQEDIYQGIDYHFQADLKSKLQKEEISASIFKLQEPKKQRWLSRVVGIAASLAILLGIGYWYLSSQSSPEDLYQAYYQPYPNIINPLERSGVLPQDQLSQAMLAYDRGNYEAALEIFEQQSDALKPSHKFYLALCQLELGDSNNAASNLREVVESQDQTFYLPALWYESLAYLKEEQTPKARETLSTLLQAENSTYHQRAREILDQL